MNAVKSEGEGDIEVWHITEADFMEAIGFDGCTSNGKIKVEFKKCAGTAVNRPTGAAVNAGSNVIERAATSEDVVSAILKFLKNPDETDRRTTKHSQASPATSGCKHSKKAARLQCHLCPFTAARKAGMVLHLNKHKRSDETDGRTTKHSQASPATSGCKRSKKTARLQCHLCPFSAAGKAGMALHLKKHERMASLSQAITSQSCDRSENRMSNRDSNHQESLFDHIKSHTENKDELLACGGAQSLRRSKFSGYVILAYPYVCVMSKLGYASRWEDGVHPSATLVTEAQCLGPGLLDSLDLFQPCSNDRPEATYSAV
ncbi:hypothetical protein MRX96_043481 [Rhipicephalus microplus]